MTSTFKDEQTEDLTTLMNNLVMGREGNDQRQNEKYYMEYRDNESQHIDARGLSIDRSPSSANQRIASLRLQKDSHVYEFPDEDGMSGHRSNDPRQNYGRPPLQVSPKNPSPAAQFDYHQSSHDERMMKSQHTYYHGEPNGNQPKTRNLAQYDFNEPMYEERVSPKSATSSTFYQSVIESQYEGSPGGMMRLKSKTTPKEPKIFDFSDSAIERSASRSRVNNYNNSTFISDESFAYPHSNLEYGGGSDGYEGKMKGSGRYPYDIPMDEIMSKDLTNQSRIYEVRFKHKKAEFMLAYDCPRDITIGDLVKVEADRGTDIGEVDAILPILSPSGVSGMSRLGTPIRKILGRATNGEAMFIVTKARDEVGALQVCRDMVARRSMQIQVLDAEFQFDRKKLTFIFTSDKRTDFRELVRDLFGFFKTRIWMQKISVAQAAALKLLPPFMPHTPKGMTHDASMMSGQQELYEHHMHEQHVQQIQRHGETGMPFASYPSSAPPTPKYYTGGNDDEDFDPHGMERSFHHQMPNRGSAMHRMEKLYARRDTYPTPPEANNTPPQSDYSYTTQGPPTSDGAPTYIVHHVYYSAQPPASQHSSS